LDHARARAFFGKKRYFQDNSAPRLGWPDGGSHLHSMNKTILTRQSFEKSAHLLPAIHSLFAARKRRAVQISVNARPKIAASHFYMIDAV
jgi:hypothetical protein